MLSTRELESLVNEVNKMVHVDSWMDGEYEILVSQFGEYLCSVKMYLVSSCFPN